MTMVYLVQLISLLIIIVMDREKEILVKFSLMQAHTQLRKDSIIKGKNIANGVKWMEEKEEESYNVRVFLSFWAAVDNPVVCFIANYLEKRKLNLSF